MKKIFKIFKNFISLRKKRAAARPTRSIVVVNKDGLDVSDKDLVADSASEEDKKIIRQYTKKLVSALTVSAIIWISWSYLLATYALITFQDSNPLSSLSEKVCGVVIGVVVSYCIKAFLETFAEKKLEIETNDYDDYYPSDEDSLG